MSKMSAELEKRLDANKYEMWDLINSIRNKIVGRGGTYEHSDILWDIDKVINAIEKG